MVIMVLQPVLLKCFFNRIAELFNYFQHYLGLLLLSFLICFCYYCYLFCLNSSWASCGSIKGLKARGGYGIDIEWCGGIVAGANITSIAAKQIQVKGPGLIIFV
jgi:hypothetical protein